MKKQDFLNDVMHEINTLKKLATPEELKRLNFKFFNPHNPRSCIYGQMTGKCNTVRAKELMDKACIKIFDIGPQGVDKLEDKTFREIKDLINGENKSQSWGGRYSDNLYHRNYSNLSALEGYINLKGAKNKQILEYLKGVRDTLKL